MNMEAEERRLVRFLANNGTLTRGKLTVWLASLSQEQIDELVRYCIGKGSIKAIHTGSTRNGREIIKYALPDYESENVYDTVINDSLINTFFIQNDNTYGKVISYLDNGYYLVGVSDELDALKNNKYDSKKVLSLSDMTGLILYDVSQLEFHSN